MSKRFKTKKKNYFFKFILIISIIMIVFIITFKELINNFSPITIDSTKYLKYLLKTGFNNQLEEYKFFNIFNPSSLLSKSLNKAINPHQDTVEEVIKELNPIPKSDPLVYIYNTHQTEEYKSQALQDYNLNPTVLMASYYFQEKLNDYGLPTLLETSSIKDILNTNSWNYAYSYKASRILLEQALDQNPSLKFFIDFHRDSSVYDKTTFTIDDKSYAKILFIIGEENPNFTQNLTFTTALNDRLIALNPEISRGIYKKSGPGVNGIYNQDFHPHTILMEVGGQYNTIEEVCNTIELVSKTIADFIKETYEEEK